MFSIKIFKKYCSAEWLPIFELNKKAIAIKAKQRIFNEGENVDGIYFIENGKVKVLSRFSATEEKIIRLAGDGMILGHRGINVKKYPISAEAITDCSLTFVPIGVFINILKANPELSVYLIKFMSDELRESEDRMKNLLISDPKKRVALILIKLIDDFGYDKNDKHKLAFTLSRNEMANIAGLTYETIIRTLSYFEEHKLISLIGKEIAIEDETKLRTISEDRSSSKKTPSLKAVK